MARILIDPQLRWSQPVAFAFILSQRFVRGPVRNENVCQVLTWQHSFSYVTVLIKKNEETQEKGRKTSKYLFRDDLSHYVSGPQAAGTVDGNTRSREGAIPCDRDWPNARAARGHSRNKPGNSARYSLFLSHSNCMLEFPKHTCSSMNDGRREYPPPQASVLETAQAPRRDKDCNDSRESRKKSLSSSKTAV